MRKRNCEWKTRLTEEENKKLTELTLKLKMTKQEFGKKCLFSQILLTEYDRETIEEMLMELKQVRQQLRGMGTNVNQMAKIANMSGKLPELEQLEEIQIGIEDAKMEVDELWRSLKSLLTRRRIGED